MASGFSETSDPREKGLHQDVFYNLGNHTLSLPPYSISYTSQPYVEWKENTQSVNIRKQ